MLFFQNLPELFEMRIAGVEESFAAMPSNETKAFIGVAITGQQVIAWLTERHAEITQSMHHAGNITIDFAGPDKAIGIWFPDLPGCFSAGDDVDEALDR